MRFGLTATEGRLFGLWDFRKGTAGTQRSPPCLSLPLQWPVVLTHSLPTPAFPRPEFAGPPKPKVYSFFLLCGDLALANSSGGPKTLMYRVSP